KPYSLITQRFAVYSVKLLEWIWTKYILVSIIETCKRKEFYMNLEVLISTIVTSTAALIAIIGGFLVSRVITLSSEQNGINRKLRELNNEINAKKNLLA